MRVATALHGFSVVRILCVFLCVSVSGFEGEGLCVCVCVCVCVVP